MASSSNGSGILKKETFATTTTDGSKMLETPSKARGGSTLKRRAVSCVPAMDWYNYHTPPPTKGFGLPNAPVKNVHWDVLCQDTGSKHQSAFIIKAKRARITKKSIRKLSNMLAKTPEVLGAKMPIKKLSEMFDAMTVSHANDDLVAASKFEMDGNI